MEKYKKGHTKIINWKYQLWHWRVWITWWIIFCTSYSRLLYTYLRKHRKKIDNPSTRIYVNKIKNRIIFKIKTGYLLELLTPEAVKLLWSTKIKINKDKRGENVPHVEITGVVLIRCNIVNNDYQQDSRVFYTFVPNKLFGQLLDRNSKLLEKEDEINITLVIN